MASFRENDRSVSYTSQPSRACWTLAAHAYDANGNDTPAAQLSAAALR